MTGLVKAFLHTPLWWVFSYVLIRCLPLDVTLAVTWLLTGSVQVALRFLLLLSIAPE